MPVAWNETKNRPMARDLVADVSSQWADYTAEQERYDTETFESQPYSAAATADVEAHYLWQAGFVSYCSCSRCEQLADAQAAADEEVRWFDHEASVQEIDEAAEYSFRTTEAARAAEFAPDPWGAEAPF